MSKDHTKSKHVPEQLLLGLIGENIAYSLSPVIHNLSAKKLGISADYRVFSMDGSELAKFASEMWRKGATGFNVTQPHKRMMAKITNNQELSAVNTLYRGNDSWFSTSTDGDGFAAALERIGWPLNKFETILILGAGGASISILEYLSIHRFKGTVMVAARRTPSLTSFEKLQNISPICVAFDPKIIGRLIANQPDCLVLQATSAPLRGDDLSTLLPAFEDFRGVYFDMTYSHRSAPLEFCRGRGLPAIDGIPMLIEQARASQKLWWGAAADYEFVAEQLSKHIDTGERK